MFVATCQRLALPASTPAHLGYASNASDSEIGDSEGFGSDSDSNSGSSDDSSTSATQEKPSSPLPGLRRCSCCEYCANESKFRSAPLHLQQTKGEKK
jgi:hypothetical protein